MGGSGWPGVAPSPPLVAGAQGQLAKALAERAPKRGFKAICLGRPALDLADPATIAAAFEKYDFNLSTGAAELTQGEALEDEKAKNPKDKVSRFNVGKKPLQKLKTYIVGQYAIYKEIYI